MIKYVIVILGILTFATYSQILQIDNVDLFKPILKCSYNKLTASCSGKCGLIGQCCVFAFAQLVDGTPLCQCKKQAKCTNCVYKPNPATGQKCFDTMNTCKLSGQSNCCNFLKLFSPIDLSYPLCYCQQNSPKCGNACKFNYNKGKCQDTTGFCSKGKCCKYDGLDVLGKPSCSCTQDVKLCSFCQFDFTSLSYCSDPTKTCTGQNCCKFQYKDGVKKCRCNACPPPQPNCKWIPQKKVCYDTNNVCKGDKCCKPTGQILADGTPHCQCQLQTASNPCSSCLWNGQQCKDQFGKCPTGSCCTQQFIPGSNQFYCKCNQCPDNCRYNPDLLKCQDPTGQCSGQECCSYQGVTKDGLPICRCTSDLSTCSNCERNLKSTGAVQCYDPTFQKCTNLNCCQLEYVSDKAKICQCKACFSQQTCIWQKTKQVCYDPTLTCSGNNCCRPTKALDANGYPKCQCMDCTIPPPVDNCRYNPNLLKCEDLTGKCTGQQCCAIAGVDSFGLPICKCTKQLTLCENCQLNPLSTSVNDICYDPLKTCTGQKCCQLQYMANAKICRCKKCQSCTWIAQKQACYDQAGTCTGNNCCRPQKDLLGNIFCKCVLCQ